jgi:hypothetical protein
MNFANADTLAPIVKKRRSEPERGELFVFIQQIFIQQIQEQLGDSLETRTSLR